jgi:hypothetical protein
VSKEGLIGEKIQIRKFRDSVPLSLWPTVLSLLVPVKKNTSLKGTFSQKVFEIIPLNDRLGPN